MEERKSTFKPLGAKLRGHLEGYVDLVGGKQMTSHIFGKVS